MVERRLCRDLIDSEWLEKIKRHPKCLVIDQEAWKNPSYPVTISCREWSGDATRSLGMDWHKDVFPGLKAVSSLKIERHAGMTYIVMPKGITFRMLSELLAGALGEPTCFKYITPLFPATYWDMPVKEAYAFGISNSVIENSREAPLQTRIEIPGKNGCEVIRGINQLALLALTYVVTQEPLKEGIRLYSDNPCTYTCVQINDLFFEIGDFASDGLDFVHYPDSGYEYSGTGAMREFRLQNLPQ